jgi:adenylate cyclase
MTEDVTQDIRTLAGAARLGLAGRLATPAVSELRALVHRQPPERLRLPAFLSRIVRVGIVTADPEIARREVLTNIAAWVVALNALVHLVIGMVHDPVGLMPLHAYNLAVIAIALALPALHRFGENLAAIGVCTLIVIGHSFVVLALGPASDLQFYFVLAGFLLFLFGVENWRLFVVFWLAAFAALVLTVAFGRPEGLLAPEDVAFREFLSFQALVNAMVINGAGVAFVVASLTRAQRDLARQVEVSDALVDVLLPKAISHRLKSGHERHIADRVENATVMFADLSGFTPAAGAVTANELVAYLDELFSGFDGLSARFGVDKIKTIGDSYMAAGALNGDARSGAIAVGTLAIALRDFAASFRSLGGVRLSLRVGIHSGPLVAGVIGDLRVSYDVWGDTVNLAQRLESHGEPGRIHVSAAFRELAGPAFNYEDRPPVDIKGIGEMQTWFLARRD